MGIFKTKIKVDEKRNSAFFRKQRDIDESGRYSGFERPNSIEYISIESLDLVRAEFRYGKGHIGPS